MKKASKHVEFIFDERSRSKEGDPCFCPCHVYPGAYPTNKEKPCIICHHVDDDGHLRGTSRDGWIQDHEPAKQLPSELALRLRVGHLEKVLNLIIDYEDVPIISKQDLIELARKGLFSD